MEVHRLKPMVKNYDPAIFNLLYSKTENLRKKLTSEISHDRFGLSREDILSWFDDKFIYVFNKYYDKGPDILLGHLINSLKLFKCRILRAAYTEKYSQRILPMDDLGTLDNHITYDPFAETHLTQYNYLITLLKPRLSDNALYLLELQLNPPPYILSRLNKSTDKRLVNVNDALILEYFNLPINQKTLKYILGLKSEIKMGVNYVKQKVKAS